MSKCDSTLSVERLKELFTYHPDGHLLRRVSIQGKRHPAGQIVRGTSGKDGYRLLGIDRRMHMVHRCVWALVHGKWPNGEIDHINRIKDDNRIENLREATREENAQNGPMRRHNTSGYKGVWKMKAHDLWCAEIGFQGERIKLGYFRTPQEAALMYQEAAAFFHTHNPHVMQSNQVETICS